MKSIWRIWCKALGEKASSCDKESDKIALVRTLIFITYFVTNIAIVSGVIRHWNDSNQKEVKQYLDTSVMHQF
jgi:hypothetical protein